MGKLISFCPSCTIGKDCVQAGHNYLYKGRLSVGFLGLVDDIVGVTETGIAAQK